MSCYPDCLQRISVMVTVLAADKPKMWDASQLRNELVRLLSA